MEKEKTCFFVGHKKMTKNELERVLVELNNEIEILILNGIKDFICGGQLGFDLIVASFIVVKKEQGHDVRLDFALPYNGYEKYFTEEEKKLISDLVGEADTVKYISDSDDFNCSKNQYEYMAEKSSHCIYCLKGKKGEMIKFIERDKGKADTEIKFISI